MIIDISRPLDEETAVYPGDVPFSREVTMSISSGDCCNVSAVRGSSHAGTHVDLPQHLANTHSMPPLDVFCGPAIVVAGDMPSIPAGSRVLVKGQKAMSEATVRWLIDSKSILIGVETMSVDPMGDEELRHHRALMDAGVTILECLDLENVDPGEYELIALPLKIPNADATWVRAVLKS